MTAMLFVGGLLTVVFGGLVLFARIELNKDRIESDRRMAHWDDMKYANRPSDYFGGK